MKSIINYEKTFSDRDPNYAKKIAEERKKINEKTDKIDDKEQSKRLKQILSSAMIIDMMSNGGYNK